MLPTDRISPCKSVCPSFLSLAFAIPFSSSPPLPDPICLFITAPLFLFFSFLFLSPLSLSYLYISATGNPNDRTPHGQRASARGTPASSSSKALHSQISARIQESHNLLELMPLGAVIVVSCGNVEDVYFDIFLVLVLFIDQRAFHSAHSK